MTQLADVLTKDSVTRLHEAFKSGVLVVEKGSKGQPGFNRESFAKVGEPLMRWVHYKLMESARLDPRSPFPDHPYQATRSVISVLVDEGLDREEYRRLAGDVSRNLQANGLAVKRGKAGGRLFLRDWTPGLTYKPVGSGSKKVDLQLEKRIEEEGGKPTVSRIDLRSFKVPDPTPEKVLEFIQSFVPAALKVQDTLTQTRQALLEAQNRIVELETAKVETNEWEGVSESIGDLLK